MSKLSRARGRRHKKGRVKEAYLQSYRGYGYVQQAPKSPRDYQGEGYPK